MHQVHLLSVNLQTRGKRNFGKVKETPTAHTRVRSHELQKKHNSPSLRGDSPAALVSPLAFFVSVIKE